MKNYLEFLCGDYRLLIEQDRVCEIVSAHVENNAGNVAPLFYQWRGMDIPVMDLKRELDAQDTPSLHQIIIESRGEGGCKYKMLRVDKVMGFHSLPSEQFQPLPFFSARLSRMINASIFIDAAQCNGLRINTEYFGEAQQA